MSYLMHTVAVLALAMAPEGAFERQDAVEAPPASQPEVVTPATAEATQADLPPAEAISPMEPVDLTPPPVITAKAVAFADLSDAEIFERAVDAIEAIDTLTAKFVQTSPTGDTLTGTLNIDRPGRLRFDYDQPSDQLIVATNGLVYVHDAALETTDSYPVAKTPLKFLLARTIDRDAGELQEIYRSEDGVALMLQSSDEDVSGQLALVFGAPDMTLKEWVVIEPNGAATRVLLSDVELGGRIAGRLFRVPDSGGAFLRDR